MPGAIALQAASVVSAADSAAKAAAAINFPDIVVPDSDDRQATAHDVMEAMFRNDDHVGGIG